MKRKENNQKHMKFHITASDGLNEDTKKIQNVVYF